MTETSDPYGGLRRIAAAYSGHWLYLLGDEGVLYSETQNRFVGLNAAAVFAYRAFDAGVTVEELNAVADSQSSGLVSTEAMITILGLSRGVFPSENSPAAWPPLQQPVPANLAIYDVPVFVDFPKGPLEDLCRYYFQRFSPSDEPAKCRISALRAHERWTIDINGSAILSSLRDEQLGLAFMHAARSVLYAESKYDIAFHAAMVSNHECGILLCGPREAGKSTLAAYLLAHSFDVISDEPALLDLDTGGISSLRVPLSLKEGSWSVLCDDLPELSSAPIHVRSDGTKIRLLHSTVNDTPASRALTHIVFPEYRSSSITQARRLTPLQTLNLLNEAGMILARHLSRRRFEVFLRKLCATPAYALRYASLEQAASFVSALIPKDADWQTTESYAKL